MNQNHVEKIEVILADLDAADSIEHMKRPGYRLHRLTENLKGCHTVDVSGNWRITFRFEEGNVFDADLIDYH